jgi:putative resolvase
MKERERVKLSQFAKNQGITYQSAWKMWERGEIEGIKLESGTILVSGWAKSITDAPKAVIYVRVNDPKLGDTIKDQIKEAQEYCIERDYEVVDIVSEISQGINFNKPKLIEVLKRDNWDTLVIRDTRTVGYLGFDIFAAALGSRKVESLHEVEIDDKIMIDLFQKIISWSRQVIGMGSQKRAIYDLMNKINY